MYYFVFFFFFKQKTAYEMRISDWSSDVCSSDLFWLLYYSFRNDAGGGLTLDNFVALVADPTLPRAYGIAIGMAAGVGLLSCLIATPVAWLVSRTDLPGRRTIRVLVTASFVPPPFLGAIAYEILAAPNRGLANILYRKIFGDRKRTRMNSRH